MVLTQFCAVLACGYKLIVSMGVGVVVVIIFANSLHRAASTHVHVWIYTLIRIWMQTGTVEKISCWNTWKQVTVAENHPVITGFNILHNARNRCQSSTTSQDICVFCALRVYFSGATVLYSMPFCCTGLCVKSVGGRDSAEMRGPVIRITAHSPILSYSAVLWRHLSPYLNLLRTSDVYLRQ